MRTWALAAAIALSGLSVAYAHLCNNVYRTPARFVIKPEKPITYVDKSDEVRIFVQNNYPVTINKVVLTAKSDDDVVQTEVTPSVIETMRPGARATFTVKMTVPDKAPSKRHKMTIGFSAMQIGFQAADESSVSKLRQIVTSAQANPCTRVLAAEVLAKRGDPVAFQFLREMAQRNTSDYRSRAIRALGRLGNKATFALLRDLARDRDGYLKGNALMALGLADAPLAPVEAALADKDPFVKICAQAALTCRGSKDHLEALKAAMKDADEYVQVAAAWGLATTAEKEAVDLLDAVMSSGSKDIRLRIFAGEALISLPDRDRDSAGN